MEGTRSDVFLQTLKKELVEDTKVAQEFMNKFFNTLNDLTTDLFVIFKEIIDHDPEF